MPIGDNILNVALATDAYNTRRSLYMEDMYEIVEKVLKIDPASELGVLQRCGAAAKSWNIPVKNEEIYYRLDLESFIGKRFRLPNGAIVIVNRAFEKYTHIVVKDVPPFWGDEIVERIFSTYGRISEIKQEVFKFGVYDCRPAYKEVWDGNWRIKIILDKQIPSSLRIDGHKIDVFYKGQPKTCFNCGGNHFFYEKRCDTQHLNRFKLDNFPTLLPQETHEVEEPASDEDAREEQMEENNNVDENNKKSETTKSSDPKRQEVQPMTTPQISQKNSEPEKNPETLSGSDDTNSITEAPLENVNDDLNSVTKAPLESNVEEKEEPILKVTSPKPDNQLITK